MLEEREQTKISTLDSIKLIDKQILELIANRSLLINKIRKTNSLNKAVSNINVEKELRKSWEKEAVSVSKDEKLIYQVFSLLQEIVAVPKQDEDEKVFVFNLAPSPKEVNIELEIIPAVRKSLIWVSLAACCDRSLKLEKQLLGDHLIGLIKSFNQLGAHLSWNNEGTVTNRQARVLDFKDKVIFIGDSLFNFYLLSAIALSYPGKVKFTGGSDLKMANLGFWRNFLPQFGARLAHVIPKSTGLPVHQESSAMIPDEVYIPLTLCKDALMAILIASGTFKKNIVFINENNIYWEDVCSEILPILESYGIKVQKNNNNLMINSENFEHADYPQQPKCYLDALISANLLAIPIFIGGQTVLHGNFDSKLKESSALIRLLTWAGVDIVEEENIVKAVNSGKIGDNSLNKLSLIIKDLGSDFVPLILVLLALKLNRKIDLEFSIDLLDLNFGVEAKEGFTSAGVENFLAQFNVQIVNKKLVFKTDNEPVNIGAYTAFNASWAMALALGAYLKSNIKLTNPGVLNEIMPSFWLLYNALPKPIISKCLQDNTEIKSLKKVRHRVIVD